MELVNYDNIITASGRKLKKSKKIVKNIKEEHDMFIDFVLKHLPNVSREDVFLSLDQNKNDYECVLYDLLD